MKANNRFKVIWASMNVKLLLIMGLAYGILFGGISQGFMLAAGKTTVPEFFVNIFFYGAGYECMFLFIILIVLVAVTIKGFLSLGMERLTAYQIWRDVLLCITGFMIVFINIVIWYGSNSDETFIKTRILNMDINALNPVNGSIIFLFILLIIFFFNLSTSFVVNIANKFGLINCFAAVGVFVSFILFSIPTLKQLLIWGDAFMPICLVLFLLNCALYGGNKKLIMNTEVTR